MAHHLLSGPIQSGKRKMGDFDPNQKSMPNETFLNGQVIGLGNKTAGNKVTNPAHLPNSWWYTPLMVMGQILIFQSLLFAKLVLDNIDYFFECNQVLYD